MKGIAKRISVTGLFLMALLLLAPAVSAAEGIRITGGPGSDTIEIQYYRWLKNDIVRNIEEIRLAKHPEDRRELVEDIEDDIYNKVEYPLSYRQSERTDELVLGRIGVTSDVVDAGEASPVASEIAQTYALLGIAKGYEGFGMAADDLFEKARGIYANVMNSTISLDHNDDNRTLNAWISSSRGYWGNSTTTRVTFIGKKVSQKVVDRINFDNIDIVRPKAGPGYTEYVAKRDFVRGMKRYIETDASLPGRKENRFQIYLQPGTYTLENSLAGKVAAEFKVSANPNRNRYIVETLGSVLVVHPVPDILDFEEKMRNMKLQGRPDDILFPPSEDELPSDGSLLNEEPLP